MRLVTSTCVAWLITAGVSAQPAKLDAEFSRLEEVWNTAHRDADAEALAALWAEDLEVVVPRMPPMSKADALAFVRTGRMRFERYETSPIKVRTYGDTAVVTGRLQRTRTIAGKQTTDDWRFTKVYVRHNGMWRVVSFHASDSSASSWIRRSIEGPFAQLLRGGRPEALASCTCHHSRISRGSRAECARRLHACE